MAGRLPCMATPAGSNRRIRSKAATVPLFGICIRVHRLAKANRAIAAANFSKIFAVVGAATVLLIGSELSTWVSLTPSAIWIVRLVRIAFEMTLAFALCFVIFKKESQFRETIVDEEQEHDLAEERMRIAMEAANVGYWDWNLIDDTQVWSETCKSLLGLPPESATGMSVLMNSIHPHDREYVRASIHGAIDQKQSYFCKFRVLWPDGTMHWQSARGRAFYDENGHTIRMLGVAINIDSQKAAEENLRLQGAALEAAANAIVITDAKGTILWVNQAFTSLTGYAREESIGQTTRMLKSCEHDHHFYENLWSTIRSGQVWRGEIKNRKKDGSLYNEEMTITPVSPASGEITNFIAIKQDVTDKKKLEAQYRHAQKMEAVGRLAGGIAHDFNNVLSVIIGYSSLSLEKLQPAHAVAGHLLNIKSAADRAASLVKQLLTFSRQQVVYPRIIDLNALVKNTQDMLRRLVGEDVSITVKDTTPLGTIKADVGQLEQVLMNLVVNARDAIVDGGQIIIETRNVDLDESYQTEHEPVKPGRYVMLSVSDTGCGMDEKTKARIFEPFYTTKEPGRGTGLGLATVYGIVKQSGGYIWVYSEPGQGATFKLYFPRVSDIPEVLSKPRERTEVRGGSETILLVEDDEAVRDLIVLTLQNAGYTVLDASTPEAAIELAADHGGKVDLLLSDIVMPSISGIRLTPMLRTSRPDLRVILMSGYAAETLARQAPIPPDVMFIEKPFTKVSLLTTIQNVLGGNRDIDVSDQESLE
jgi:two-component system cell cycle sensor histidine kinase/response regulator CckA